MSREKHIDKIYNSEEPAPTDEKEHEEHYDVNHALRAKHNGKPYKALNNPTYEGYEQQDRFQKYRLTVEPFVEIHFSLSFNDNILLPFPVYYTALLSSSQRNVTDF